MKNIILIILIILSTFCLVPFLAELHAQGTYSEDLKVIYIKKDLTLHFRSPERINYVDISSDIIAGDLPLENIAKIKLYNDTIYTESQDLGVISIVGDSYLAQYRIVYSEHQQTLSEIPIEQEDMRPTQFPGVSLTYYELKEIALKVQKRNRRFRKVQSQTLGMKGYMNNIYAYGDYIFLDLTFENTSKIKYDIDLVRFMIDDKKIYKATNNQSIEIKPIFTLYRNPYFQKSYRNIYVFPKFTFPNDKVLRIRIEEEQISGRALELAIDYKELLNADTF